MTAFNENYERYLAALKSGEVRKSFAEWKTEFTAMFDDGSSADLRQAMFFQRCDNQTARERGFPLENHWPELLTDTQALSL